MSEGEQQFLFDITPEPRKLSRSGDPVTSHLSAEQVAEFSARHHRLIYDALCHMEDGTFYEIAEVAGLEPSAVWRRLNEMEVAGRIFTTGQTRLGPKGRLCRVWKAHESAP